MLLAVSGSSIVIKWISSADSFLSYSCFNSMPLLLCKLVRVGCIAILLALGCPESGSHTCNGIGFLNLESLGNSLSICVFKDLHFPVMVGIQGLMGRGQWFREGLYI